MNTNQLHRIFRSFAIPSFTLLILLFVACDGPEEPREVGLVVPLSGHAKFYGRSVERGAELALAELREQAGETGEVPFVLDVRDSGSHPQRAAELAAELYDAGALAVIGGATRAEATAMSPVAGEAKRVLISPSSSSDGFAHGSRYVFRLSPSDHQQAVKMGGFAAMELDLTKAALMVPRSDAGHELGEVFRDQFERHGGEVVEAISYEERDKPDKVQAAVDEILARRPQAVYLAASGGDAAARRIVAQLAAGGFQGTIMTTSAFAAAQLLSEGGGTEGLVVSSGAFDTASEDPVVQSFVDRYRQAYDAEPDTFAAQGYDAVMALAEAMKGEIHRPRELWQGLRGLSGFEGVTGIVQFDEQGNVSQFPRVYIVEGGKLEQLEGDGADGRLASVGPEAATAPG